MFVIFLLIVIIGQTTCARRTFTRLRNACGRLFGRGNAVVAAHHVRNYAEVARIRKIMETRKKRIAEAIAATAAAADNEEEEEAAAAVVKDNDDEHRNIVKIECSVCWEQPIVTLIAIPCGHIYCAKCINRMKESRDREFVCAICIRPIIDTIIPPSLQNVQYIAAPPAAAATAEEKEEEKEEEDDNDGPKLPFIITILCVISCAPCLFIWCSGYTIVYFIRGVRSVLWSIIRVGCKATFFLLAGAMMITLVRRSALPDIVAINGDDRNIAIGKFEPLSKTFSTILHEAGHQLLPITIKAPPPRLCIDTDTPLYVFSYAAASTKKQIRPLLKPTKLTKKLQMPSVVIKASKQCSAHT